MSFSGTADRQTDNPTCYELFVFCLEKIAGISMYVDFDGFLKDAGDKWERLRSDCIKKAVIVFYELPTVKSNRLQENILSKLALFEGGFEKGIEQTKAIIEKDFEHYTKAIVSKMFYDLETYAYFADKESVVSFGNWCLDVMKAFYAREALRQDMEVFF